MNHNFFGLFVALLCLSGCYGGISLCSKGCQQTQSLYKPGHSYVFSFAGAFRIDGIMFQVKKSSDELIMNATVELDILSPCDMEMKVKEVTFNFPDEDVKNKLSGTLGKALTTNSLYVHYNQQKIIGLCSLEGDSREAINVRRGILSMLQYTKPVGTQNYTVTESDIMGTCQSLYAPYKSEGNEHMRRERDLENCLNRRGPSSVPKAVVVENPYYPETYTFKSEQVCIYRLDESGIPVRVACEEAHVSKNIVTTNTQTVITVNQTLELREVVSKEGQESTPTDEKAMKIQEEENLFFNPSYSHAIKFKTFQQSLEVFKSLELNLIEMMWIMRSSDFMALFRKASSQELIDGYVLLTDTWEKQYSYIKCFDQAMTANSVKAMLKLHEMERISKAELSKWISFVQFWVEYNLEILEALKPLLEISTAMDRSHLVVSTLVRNFCREVANCQKEDVIQYYIEFWDNKIKEDPKKTPLLYEKSLKAIGNTGLTNHLDKIVENINNADLSPIMRITAMEALRKMRCETTAKYYLQPLKESSNSAYFRIQAYMKAIKCRDLNTMESIISLVRTEETNMVTSFIWDHLSRSKYMSDKIRDNVEQLLKDKDMITKYEDYVRPFKYFENYSNMTELNSDVILNQLYGFENNALKLYTIKMEYFTHNTETDDFLTVDLDIIDIESLAKKIFIISDKSKENETPKDSDNIIPGKENEKIDILPITSIANFYLRIFNNEVFSSTFLDMIMSSVPKGNSWMKYLEGNKTFNEIQNRFRAKFVNSYPTMLGFQIGYESLSHPNIVMNISSNTDFTESPKLKFDCKVDIDCKLDGLFTTAVYLEMDTGKIGLKDIVNIKGIIKAKAVIDVEDGIIDKLELVLKDDNAIFTADVDIVPL